ncbi:cardiolipin synthetase, partial [gut metagenome]
MDQGVVVTVPSGPYSQREANLYLLLQAINDAQHSITITTPYFVPNEVLSAALLNAAYRGVSVTLIVPEKADSAMVSWAGRRHYHDLLEAGVRILTYHGGLLHTKSIAIDGEYAVFGTVNFDNRSLHLNFEMMLLIFDTSFLQALKKLHEQYETQCNPIDAKNWQKRPIYGKIERGSRLSASSPAVRLNGLL